jgi:hypothetical protein
MAKSLQPLIGVFTNQRYEVVSENTDHRLKRYSYNSKNKLCKGLKIPCSISTDYKS